MKPIHFDNCTVALSETFSLNQLNWKIEPGQHWVVIGANGSGKSALAAALAGEGQILAGQLAGLPQRSEIVSFESQKALIERERLRDDSDITDKIFAGTPVQEILTELILSKDSIEPGFDEGLLDELIQLFGFEHLLDRSFRSLSTGETRKAMLIRAIAVQPQLLILDEPYEGLDVESVAKLQDLLATMVDRLMMVFIVNRFDEIPDLVSHIAYMEAAQLLHTVDVNNELEVADLYQLLHLRTTNLTIPKTELSLSSPTLNPANPLVRMKNLRIAYGDKVIFENLDWTVEPNQHWQVTGSNGSGKTCLLNLITGDHPQCYNNDIFVFGYQRGQGESIWQIKQHIGYVSAALQWEYRVSINLHNVIISGFYDSIGLYQKATETQKSIASEWLDLLAMNDRADQPFNQLSYGDQRLLLIARAMVKHPDLLILDEPCLGLDDINRQLVLALIDKICADSKTTVIYVNHHAEDKIPGIKNYLSL